MGDKTAATIIFFLNMPEKTALNLKLIFLQLKRHIEGNTAQKEIFSLNCPHREF